ncbi:MAG: small, acid-soluble spore protein, alpha/beta type [Bacillota bacterium]
MDKIPVNPKAKKAYDEMKNEMASELGIEKQVIDKGNLPSRLFGYYGGFEGGNVEGLMTKVQKQNKQ